MGNRFINERIAGTGKPGFTFIWPQTPGLGRYWKRQLSKSRRRAARDAHQRGLRHWECECNYKTW